MTSARFLHSSLPCLTARGKLNRSRFCLRFQDEMNLKVLMFQNKKLAERLEDMKADDEKMREQLVELKQRRDSDLTILSLINRHWIQVCFELQVAKERSTSLAEKKDIRLINAWNVGKTDRSQYCVRMRESPAIWVSGYVTLLWKLEVLTASFALKTLVHRRFSQKMRVSLKS